MRSPARWIVALLAVVAAGAFAVSVSAGQWWTIGEAEIGPFGTRSCLGGDCRTRGLAWAGGTANWERAAVATGAAGFIAMLVFLVLAGAITAGRVPRIAAKSAIAALVAALVPGYVFVTGLPEMSEASIDRGLILFALGLVLGLAAAIGVLAQSRTRTRD